MNNSIKNADKIIFLMVLSWFVPVGIGFKISGVALDIGKMVYLFSVFLFIFWHGKIIIKNIDKVFILLITLQFFFVVFFNIYGAEQVIYLIFYLIFYYFSYFIGRKLFYENKMVIDVLIKYISIMILFSISLIILHLNNINIIDDFRVYDEALLAHSHEYERHFSEISIGKAYLGHMVAPDHYAQFAGIMASLLLPYFLIYGVSNKYNILISLIIIYSLIATQSRVGILLILILNFIMVLLNIKNIYKVQLGIVCVVLVMIFSNNEILKYIITSFLTLSTYFGYETVESMGTGRLDFYSAYFKNISKNEVGFVFGYGPSPQSFDHQFSGVTDLAWVFYSFLEKGLILSVIYMVFYIMLTKQIALLIFSNIKKYKRLGRYIIALITGIAVLALSATFSSTNTIYFFILGMIVSLSDTNSSSKKRKSQT